ncbi:hypothetical protein E1B28_013225 [Marasmius oreades]|uniref:DUF6534 domain-containing protein n=1 Tax=Marasmius oreades TaxID=181124 RepID=A0A9P7UPN9_9AGAR|nr:uncharacterized protein E1B28_013225 [Marasmius oreades]KAG7087244.1 hypothetical protein E1B28_013225 [Marasmius oreades]
MESNTFPDVVFEILGTLIFTSLFHWALFGILTVQIFLYHKSFSRDNLSIRAISHLIYIMEALQTAWVARKLYLICGSGFGNLLLLEANTGSKVDWGDEAFVVTTGLVGLLCQCFSAWRIWVLSRSKVMTVSVVILSLLSTAATITGGAHIIESSGFVTSVLVWDINTILWAASSALCDTTITIFMGLILKRSKSRVQQGTRALITKILWLTVTTGALTTFMALSALVTFLVSPTPHYLYIIVILIGKVEAISYLAVLISRVRPGSSRDDTHALHSAFAVASAGFEVELGNSVSDSQRSVPVHVQQQVELPLPVLTSSKLLEGSAFPKDDTNTQALET